jgi:hypothetical protein
MHKTPSLFENETIVEFFSSHAAKALKQKKRRRRRLIIALLALPKILAVLYVGIAGLIEARQATAADAPVVFRTAPFVR